VTPERREAVGYLKSEFELSERRACEAVSLSRRAFRYVPQARDDTTLIEALSHLAKEHADLGFGKFFDLLRAEGHRWNHKRVHRVYCEMKLNKRRKHKRRVPARHPEPLSVPAALNRCWSADFMSDALGDGRRFRTFNVIDDHRREVLAIEIDLNLGSRRVVRVLDRIAETRGLPERIRFDNGPEFTSIAVADWAEQNGVELEFIKPGRPMQNGFIERFNRTYRQAILDMYIFESLDEVRELTARWIDFYNRRRPHDSLGGKPPRSSCGPVLQDPDTPV
jgi:putative transposase